MTTRVALVGASGKLGGVIAGVIRAEEGFELVAELGSRDGLDRLAEADLVVDATAPEVSPVVLRRAVALRKNALVATSGWSAADVDGVRAEVDAAGVGVLFVPNFSLGSVLGTALATIAGRFFDSIEIVETHRGTKVDSPSGTAVRTAELIRAARGSEVEAPFSEQPARGQTVAGIPVHSLRRPGVIARQESFFSGPGETLSIVHDTVDPAAAYAPGIRLALSRVGALRGVTVGLDAFIDLSGTA